MRENPSVCVIGLGYIGLPTAILFANSGLRVYGCDINDKLVELINSKKAPNNESELGERLSEAVDSGLFYASNRPTPCDIYIITVQTPFNVDSRTADLRYLVSAMDSLKDILKDGDLIIIESTIPPGTMQSTVAPHLGAISQGKNILLAHVPEHALVGRLFYELVNNSRLIGGIDDESTEAAASLYSKVVKGELIRTNAGTAEMVKIMENTYRDVNIALANDFARYAENAGIDVWEAIKAANHHPRVHIHLPGPGVGGECIAVDPLFLLNRDDVDLPMVRTARNVNGSMPSYVVSRILDVCRESGIEDPIIAILGLSFKANVADSRNSPSLELCHILDDHGLDYRAFDPLCRPGLCSNQRYSLKDTLEGADIAVVLVDHDQFRTLDPEEMKPLMRMAILYDAKRCIDHTRFRKAGFKTCLLGYRCM